MFKRFIYAGLLVAFVSTASFTTTSCGSTGGGTGGGSGGGAGGGAADPELTCDASPPATSFAKVYSDIFVPSCTATCHKAGAPDGSETYGLYNTEAAAFAQVGKKSLYAGAGATADPNLKIVAEKDLGNSTMYLKVLGRAKSPSGKGLSGQMPLGMSALSAAHKQLLKDWICSGAKM